MSDEQDILDEMRRSIRQLAPAVRAVMAFSNSARQSGQLRRDDSTLDAAERLRNLARDDPRIAEAAGRLTGPQQLQLYADQERAVRTGQPSAGRGTDTAQLADLRDFTQAGQGRPGSQSQSGPRGVPGSSTGAGERPRTPGQGPTGPGRDRGGRGGR